MQGVQYGELFIPDTGSDFATEEYEIKLPFTTGVPVPMSGSALPIIKMIDDSGDIVKNKPMLIPFGGEFVNQVIYLQDRFSGSLQTVYATIPLSHWKQNASGGFNTDDNHFGTSLTFFSSSNYPNDTLYERFWRRYIREVYGEKARRFKTSIKISPTEFANWTLNEKLLFRGAYFRFNAINNFNLNKREPAPVEIVKRIDLLNSDIAPYYPTDVLNGVVQWADSSDNSSVGDGSAEPPADIEESALAYGFFYDSGNNIAIQVGQLLIS